LSDVELELGDVELRRVSILTVPAESQDQRRDLLSNALSFIGSIVLSAHCIAA
jgi:hypothetical protein